MELKQKVYAFKEDSSRLINSDDLFLIVNGKLYQRGTEPVKAEELFINMRVHEGMVVGYSPLQDLEVTEDGFLTDGKNKICFVSLDGEQIRIGDVRNKLVMWNDKESTSEMDSLFEAITDSKNAVRNESPIYNKLIDNGYSATTKGNYSFMYKKGEEPYMFMETGNELSLLDIDGVYSNEDAIKVTILNNNKEAVYDIPNKSLKIS